MMIKARKLPATQTEGERMRATADSGATLTIPFSRKSDDPYRQVAWMLARALGQTDVERTKGQNYRTVWCS